LRLENKIKNHGLEKTVILPGYKNNMLQYMKDFDVFICPSVADEDFPYVILEAMLLGKPIIGTSIAGIPEQVLDQKNGLIIPPGDAEMLADSIMKMISNKHLIQMMAANSHNRYTENFSNETIMQRYKRLFNSIIN